MEKSNFCTVNNDYYCLKDFTSDKILAELDASSVSDSSSTDSASEDICKKTVWNDLY